MLTHEMTQTDRPHTVNLVHLAVYFIKRFWQNAASAKSSKPPNVMRKYE